MRFFESSEEFATKRRGAQETLIDTITPVVKAALVEYGKGNADWTEPIIDAVETLYAASYDAEGGYLDPKPRRLVQRLDSVWEKTDPDSDHVAISVMLANAILNGAVEQAAADDPEVVLLEWVDMHDADVRESHRDTSGQTRPPGEPFSMDGVDTPYPGYPVGPIETWINCRCTLRPTLGTSLAASAQGDTMPDDVKTEEKPEVEQPVEDGTPVPWFGVLAPEGIKSGDGRMFGEGSLTWRDLPLPLTWQKVSDDGHKGSVVVAKIEKIEMRDGLMRASGHFLPTVEADEVVGLLAEFGKFGVSVDADSTEFDLNLDEDTVVFTAARVASASVLPIPAFAEAFVSLGVWDDEEEPDLMTEPVEAAVVPDPDDPDEECVEWDDEGNCVQRTTPKERMQVGTAPNYLQVEASLGIMAMRAKTAQFVDVAPGKTEDGPGWLTHPVDTDRLRDYWVRGPGAAKIGWGTPGDFNRCRVNVAEYVKPQHINGYCANRHYDALGVWPGPGKRGHAADADQFKDAKAGPALSLVAASGGIKAPAKWFTDPGFHETDERLVEQDDGSFACPLTVTEEGEVFGHIAGWSSCHIGFPGMCVTPPQSMSNYSYFHSGEVWLDDGSRVPVGHITIGGGHADTRMGLVAALEHYDNASAVVADISVGEDDYGIWCHGWIRPGVTDEMVYALRASTLSGDWRSLPGRPQERELIAALGVNTPGFGIRRPRAYAENGVQVSLVAAGIIAPREEAKAKQENIDIDSLALAVAEHLAGINARKEELAALAAEMNGAV